MSTLLSWLIRFYITIGQHPTLYNFLAITQEDVIQREHHLENPNTSAKPKFFGLLYYHQPVYSGEVSHHTHNSGQSNRKMSKLKGFTI